MIPPGGEKGKLKVGILSQFLLPLILMRVPGCCFDLARQQFLGKAPWYPAFMNQSIISFWISLLQSLKRCRLALNPTLNNFSFHLPNALSEATSLFCSAAPLCIHLHTHVHAPPPCTTHPQANLLQLPPPICCNCLTSFSPPAQP